MGPISHISRIGLIRVPPRGRHRIGSALAIYQLLFSRIVVLFALLLSILA
jgi:hypothetical protein